MTFTVPEGVGTCWGDIGRGWMRLSPPAPSQPSAPLLNHDQYEIATSQFHMLLRFLSDLVGFLTTVTGTFPIPRLACSVAVRRCRGSWIASPPHPDAYLRRNPCSSTLDIFVSWLVFPIVFINQINTYNALIGFTNLLTP